MINQSTQPTDTNTATTAVKSYVPAPTVNKIIVGLLPFSPVEFSGPDKYLAWIRLAGYSIIAYYTFNKMRPLSYAAMSCAGLSLATSLSASIYRKKDELSV